jgi:hypothetical protein
MVQLQDSISEHLHHHTLSNMFFDGTFKAHYVQILSCSGPWVGIWLTAWQVFPAFRLVSSIFYTTFCTQLGLPHPSIIGIPRCVCTHPIDPMGIHLLRCAHGNECIGTHDAICNTFVAIARDVGFHVGQKQLHAFLSTTFNSSRWRVDIMLTKNGIRTLADIVIADPMWANLLPWSYATQGFAASNVVQAKERSYHNRHPTNQFLPLAIELFGCLHKHANVFLHDCVNAIWSFKGTKGFNFSTLVTFLCQKVSIIYKECKRLPS